MLANEAPPEATHERLRIRERPAPLCYAREQMSGNLNAASDEPSRTALLLLALLTCGATFVIAFSGWV